VDIEKGKQKGREKEREKGKQKGREKGRGKGKQKGREKEKLAQKGSLIIKTATLILSSRHLSCPTHTFFVKKDYKYIFTFIFIIFFITFING
jgi:hypothetical protein